jgi:TolB-like protein/DNA-binding winged helix-turn-helix (wHTH) protein
MTQGNNDLPNPPVGSSRLRVADLVVDLDRSSVVRDGRVIDLPDLSFRLLAVLIRQAPERVDKDQIIAEVWDGVVVSDETLAQRVSLLRQALGESSQQPRYIQAIRGRGYRLIPHVRSVANRPTRPVAKLALGAALVLVACVLAIRWSGDSAPNAGDSPAIADVLAVLPFRDMSERQDHQFFADGMHEELLRQLSAIDNLALISRTSVEPYRQTDLGLPEIARRLGASAVLEGSVRIDEDRLRITVQLIDAASDEHVWSESYDSVLSVQSIFEIQGDVANRIANALQLQYVEKQLAKDALPTNNMNAYNLYLLGRYHTFKQTPADLASAVDFLERAIVLDSQFAEAWATLGWAYSFQGTAYGGQRPHDVYPKAKEAALRAIALDAQLADARSLYADILTWYDWDFAAAEQEYLRTIDLDPLNVLGYALFLSTQERHDEAIELIERRLAVSPDDVYVRINAGWRYFHAAQFDKAIAAAERSAQHADAGTLLGWSLLASGNIERAIQVFESDIETGGRDSQRIANLAAAKFYAKRRDEALILLAELETKAKVEYVSPAVFATLHFSAGEPDEAFEKLNESLAQHDRELIFLPVSLSTAGYRNDSRYEELIRKIGFDE